MDYLENQCAKSPEAAKRCDYLEYENQDIGYADLQLSTPTKEEVRTLIKLIDLTFTLRLAAETISHAHCTPR